MTATNHALTGAVVALAIKQPVLAIPLALLSHFLIDMVPHFDSGSDHPKLTKGVVALDSMVAGAITILIPLFLNTSVSRWLIFVCMFVAISPDLVWGARYYKYRDFKKVVTEPMSGFSVFHKIIQWSETRPGAFVEVAWAIGAVSVISLIK